jgi:3-hydroxymyristoyl/3-hydroxydecanoyl-(acyl carrier protein) dehydratase
MRLQKPVMDSQEIQRHIPHRPPFLLLDRVVTMADNRIVAEKRVTKNEWFMHDTAVPMPDMLQLEAIAQAAGVCASKQFGLTGKLIVVVGMEDIRFSSSVFAGGTLTVEVELLRYGGRIAKIRGNCRVNQRNSAQATIFARVI